jgi:hypothetical protein
MDNQCVPTDKCAGELIDPRLRELSASEVDAIAAVCHEANRAYCASLGDRSQPSWDGAPDWQRESARLGVKKALNYRGKRAFMFDEGEELHNSWMEQKLRAGWRWGEVKDAVLKTHPCLLPYRSLPPAERRKDHLFRAVCQALDPRREA